MYVPEIHEQRKRISGLQMPRRYSPRLPGASTKGQTPINPYGANKMKVASLSDFRRSQLERQALKTASLTEEIAFYEAEAELERFVKTASMGEYLVFLDLQKVAETVESPDEFWDYCIHQYGDEIEKNAGINTAIAAAARFLSKGLGTAGKYTGSSTLTQYAGRAAKASSKRYAAASKAVPTPSSMAGMDKAIARQERLAELAKAQKQRAKELGRSANQQGKTPGQILSEGLRGGKSPTPKPTAPATPATATPATPATAATPPAATAATPKSPAPYNTGGGSDAAIAAAAAEAPAKGMRFGTKAKIVGTGLGIGGLVGAGMLTSKADQVGRQENLRQSQRGFNYGMR